MAAIADAPAGAEGPEPITYRQLAERVYGTDTPTRAQREAVGRACRRLIQDGQAEGWNVSEKVTRERWNVGYREKVDARVAAITRPLTADEEAAYDLACRRRDYEWAKACLRIMAATGNTDRERWERYAAIVEAGEPT